MKAISMRAVFSLLLCITVFFINLTTVNSQTVRMTENLSGEGVQKFPMNLLIDLDEKFKRKLFGLVSWKADGTAVGYNEFFYPVFIKPDGSKASIETYLPDPTDIALQPVSEKSLIFTKDNDGDENFQLYQLDLDTKKTIKLTSAPATSKVNSFLWSASGDSIYFMDADKKANQSFIMRLDANTKELKKLAVVDGTTQYLSDVNKDFIVLRNFITSNETAYRILDLKTNQISSLTTETGFYRGAKFSAVSNGVWMLSNKGGNFYGLYYFDLKTKTGKKVNKTEANITGYSISPDEKRLALKINEAGSDTIHLYELAGNSIKKELPKPDINPGIILNFCWRNNDELGFTHETIKAPQGIEIYNAKTAKFQTLAKGIANEELANSLREAQAIKWKSFDKQEITGFLLKPAALTPNRKLPVIIDIHGGPKVQYQPDFNVFKTYPVSQLQIAAILPNIRGSSGFGKGFEDLDNLDKRVNAVRDLQALLDWINTQPDLDSDKIIVKGDSYGALMALALGIREPGRIKAVIAESPMISIKNTVNYVSESIRKLHLAEYGAESQTSIAAENEKLSLLNNINLSNWKIPIFLAVGQNDSRIPVKDVEELKDKLKSQGVHVWFIKAKNEGHNWSDYENRIFLNSAELYFMEKEGGF